MQSVNENTIQLFTLATPMMKGVAAPTKTNSIGAQKQGIVSHAMTPARAANASSKFGAVPMRGASVAMSAGKQNMGENAQNMLSGLANSVTQQFDQFMNDMAPQQQFQFAGAGPMPVFDASDYSKFKQQATPSMPTMFNSQMQGAADNVRMSKSSTSTRGDVRMFAGPTVSGDTKVVQMNDHMDKAMVAKMGINGFGRIGRLVFRSTFMDQADKAVCVAINAPGKDLKYLQYLLQFDSVHGRFPGTVEIGDGGLIVNGVFVKVFDERDPANCSWGDAGAEYLCESTGVFLTQESIAGHLAGGAKKVIFAAPAKDDTPTFVYGVNHETYSSDMTVVSNASCTTNCLAPLSKVIDDAFGIDEGLMTTVHATTASNMTVDGASKKDWRGGRANGPNIIPSSTGAAKAVGLVLPQLKGKLTGMAFRVPTTNVSVVDLTVKLKKDATWEEITDAIKTAADGPMNGVVEFVDTPLVSQDFVSHAATSCFDANASIQLSPKFAKFVAWYDNEWAYSNQLVKLTHFMADKDGALVERAMAGK